MNNETIVNKQTLSQSIDYVRFPLIVLILFIHTGIEEFSQPQGFKSFEFVRHYITDELACLGVPLFFFISGFLFFYNCNGFTWDTYKKKVSSRMRSLLVPYIIWNLAYLLLKALSEMSSAVAVESKSVSDYGITDYLQVFWNIRDNMPINCPLWFVRDLIVMSLLSYAIYYIIKWTKHWLLIVLLALWIYDKPCIEPFTWQWSFFLLGAFFCIHKKIFIFANVGKNKWQLTLATLIYFFLLFEDTYRRGSWTLHNWDRVLGIFVAFSWVYYGLETNKIRVNKFLAKSSFFIFCFHYLFEQRLTMIIVGKLGGITEPMAYIIYFTIPIITIAFSLGTYWLISKYLPRLTNILIGSRK